jgi:hypothetical protein
VPPQSRHATRPDAEHVLQRGAWKPILVGGLEDDDGSAGAASVSLADSTGLQNKKWRQLACDLNWFTAGF